VSGVVISKTVILIVAMLAYDLFWIWAAVFFISWAGSAEAYSVQALPFWAMAATSVVVTGYCVSKLVAIRRGENPRI
jgi:hypothetical protein